MKGSLVHSDYKKLYDQQQIISTNFSLQQIQPASLDLTLSNECYEIKNSFLASNTTVRNKLEQLAVKRVNLNRKFIFKTNKTYIVRINERLNLKNNIFGHCNPKSSTGRLDVFCRTIVDYSDEYEKIPLKRFGEPEEIADIVYSRITGEQGYFDSRVAYVSETGKKGSREKRLAIMDFDGENVEYLTDGSYMVLAPRFSPRGDRILYTSYQTGTPQIYMKELATSKITVFKNRKGTMSFAPRFSPDGKAVVYSLEQGGNTDIYVINLSNSII